MMRGDCISAVSGLGVRGVRLAEVSVLGMLGEGRKVIVRGLGGVEQCQACELAVGQVGRRWGDRANYTVVLSHTTLVLNPILLFLRELLLFGI